MGDPRRRFLLPFDPMGGARRSGIPVPVDDIVEAVFIAGIVEPRGFDFRNIRQGLVPFCHKYIPRSFVISSLTKQECFGAFQVVVQFSQNKGRDSASHNAASRARRPAQSSCGQAM